MKQSKIITLLASKAKEVLGLDEKFLFEDDVEFSQYGMNSIVSARFSHLLTAVFGVEVTPKVIVENFTLAKLAEFIVKDLNVNPGNINPDAVVTNVTVEETEVKTEENIEAVRSPEKPKTFQQAESKDNEQIIHKIMAILEKSPDLVHRLTGKTEQREVDLAAMSKQMDFSFIFFSSSNKDISDNKYEYVTNISKYADVNDYTAVWMPERHFYEFGGIFPDPAILLAHLASYTSTVRLRSGSVVLPLHHPTRIVESWSMIDNLSNGRVDLGFASGWNPNDFVMSPDTFQTIRDVWFERMTEVEKLWRGEGIDYVNGKNESVCIKTYPRPVQENINIWMAVSGNQQTFIEAGKRGYNILTMLASKPAEELEKNIRLYRQARADHGFDPCTGKVSLMLHTFVHDNAELVDSCVNKHYFDYIKSALKGHIKSLEKAPSEAEINKIVEHSFHFQRKNSALFGDVAHCQQVVEKMRDIGVNEIACLVDFGITEQQMYETLPFVTQLKNAVNSIDAEHIDLAQVKQPAGLYQALAKSTQLPAVQTGSEKKQNEIAAEFAIVGLSGKYPGANNIDEFWQNLVDNKNSITEITDERYDWQAVYGNPKTEVGKTNIKHFGLIDNIYHFDAGFFSISRREAEVMDPHARVLLETVWSCIENAGYRPQSLNRSKTGIFVSFYNDEYSDSLIGVEIEKSSEPYLGTALSGTIKANRISFILGLNGPSEVYDTACSSSLVAMHRATQAIIAGDCDQALIAGVSLLLTPGRVISLSKMGILNETPICNSFSYPANKEVISEGVGAVFIKPLAQAVTDKDYIYAVVSGSDVNHHGDLSGRLTMPSAKSLAELMVHTYKKLHLSRQDICYIEGHGSGNDSDVVELMAFDQCLNSLDDKGDDKHKVAVGSVKSNIGFGEAVGGMAQMTKCALALHHGVIPATLHFDKVDPSFAVENSALSIQAKNSSVELTQKHYMSAVAYGLGGSNGHIVFSNYMTEQGLSTADTNKLSAYPILLSANSKTVLTAYTKQIIRHLVFINKQKTYARYCPTEHDLLHSLSLTLIQRERQAQQRIVFIVDSLANLLDCCSDYVAELDNKNIIISSDKVIAEEIKEFLDISLAQKSLRKLAVMWVNGIEVPWQDLFKNDNGDYSYQKLPLPPVPFMGEEYRLVAKPSLSIQQPAQTLAAFEERFVVNKDNNITTVDISISRHDYFINQHVVDGTPVMPGVGYLAILTKIAKTVFALDTCTIKNTAWLMPFELRGDNATMHCEFTATGQFRVFLKEQQVLCCKGQLDLTGSPQGNNFSAQLSAFTLENKEAIVDKQDYWKLVNSPESKQSHGDSFRRLAGLYQQDSACIGLLEPHKETLMLAEIPLYDSALGASIGFSLIEGDELTPAVPFSVDQFHLLQPIPGDKILYAVVTKREGKLPRYDINLEDGNGTVYVVFNGYFSKSFTELGTVEKYNSVHQQSISMQQENTAAVQQPVAISSSTPLTSTTVIANESDALSLMVNDFQHIIAQFLKADIEMVPVDESLEHLGLDSIAVNELTDQISSKIGIEIPATTMFEYTNITDMVVYLLEEFEEELRDYLQQYQGSTEENEISSEKISVSPVSVVMNHTSQTVTPIVKQATQTQFSRQNEDVAVIGIGGLYPGAEDFHEFWEKVKKGTDFISEMPEARRATVYNVFADGLTELKGLYGGFVESADKFDADFFQLSAEEVTAMDPQQRLFLQATWQAMEDAGYYPLGFGGQNIGVYVGAIANEYLQLLSISGFTSQYTGTGCAISGIANRTSYFFDLNGPSQSMDTACCSSLYAIDRAVNDINSGLCEAAIAGGVSFICMPEGFNAYHAMDYLAKDWRCKAFADEGDGWSKAELFSAVFLKSYDKALADNDHIYGVIKSTGTNHGGKSHFYEQPNSNKHAELIKNVYRNAKVDPSHVVHVEAHGTGTEMGDALEFNVISKSLKELAKEQGRNLPGNYCGVGSIKSNIGHGEAAAGIAGFVKTVMLLHDKIIPQSLHIHTPNKHIRLKNSPLFLADTERDLTEFKNNLGHDQAMYASVHSFNFSGAAAHVLVAEHTVENLQENKLPLNTYPVCISAKTAAALQDYVRRLLQQLENNHYRGNVGLESIVYTINCSKSFFEHRLAFVVDSYEALLHKLKYSLSCFDNGNFTADNGIRYGYIEKKSAKKVQEYPALSQDTVTQLIEQWLTELNFDWAAILQAYGVMKCSLPTYPFANKDSYFPQISDVADTLRGEALAAQEKFSYHREALVDNSQLDAGQAVQSGEISSSPPISSSSVSLPSVHSVQVSVEPIEYFMRETLANIFSVSANDIDLQDKVNSYPFDSLKIVGLSDKINQQYSLETTPPDFFTFIQLQEIVDFIAEQLPELPASETITANNQSPIKESVNLRFQPNAESFENSNIAAATKEAIAIIGISAAFPQSPDINSFWQNLNNAKDCISEVPADRWDWQAYYGDPLVESNKTNVKWGGFVADLGDFDPLFFEISPREAEMMDPQQRLLLMHVWQAIEDTGYAPSSLSGTNTAILLGTASNGYEQLLAQHNIAFEGHTATGVAPSMGPNRISFALNLHGPSEPIDTACSSSLVAIHRGMGILRNGESDLAIAGGVNTIISPDVHISLNRAGMLSEDGRCKTFSNQANGYARGEGVGIVVLKPLSKAEQDGDHIYGVLLSSAENHGGHANSLTAPNPKAQAALIGTALRQANIDPRTVTYIEAHGTGTELGDPVEINGLKAALKSAYADIDNSNSIENSRCGLGTVKSNIGHLELAAGVAGVIKVLLQLKYKTLAKSLHTETLNPYIKLTNSPFYIVQETQNWEALSDVNGNTIPRRAGVSSFGFGGVNAHVVIEEYIARQTPVQKDLSSANEAVIVLLSARKPVQLNTMAANLLQKIDSDNYTDKDLPDIAYTLQMGRDCFNERLAFTVTNIAELKSILQKIPDNNIADHPQIHRGSVDRSQDTLSVFKEDDAFQTTVDKWIADGKYNKLMELWVKGLDVQWSALYLNKKPSRLSLPAYPFMKKRFWIGQSGKSSIKQAEIINTPAQQVTQQSLTQQSIAHTEEKIAAVNQQRTVLPATQSPVTVTTPMSKPTVSLQSLGTDMAMASKTSAKHSLSVQLNTVNNEYSVNKKTVHEEPTPKDVEIPTGQPASITGTEKSTEVIDKDILADKLRDGLANALYIDSADITDDNPFVELGLDSIIAVEWVRWMNREFNMEMPVTKLYDHPTIAQLAAYIHSLLFATGAAIETETGVASTVVRNSQDANSMLEFTASVDKTPDVYDDVAPLNTTGPDAVNSDSLVTQTAQLACSQEEVQEILQNTLAAALYIDVDDINMDTPFVELGLDSIVGVEWVRSINKALNLAVVATKVYDHPTVRQLAAYLAPLSNKGTAGDEPASNTTGSTTVTAVNTESDTNIQPQRQNTGNLDNEPQGLVISTVHKLNELVLQPWQVAVPAIGEVTIQVQASAINFPDTMCVTGLYPTMPVYPFVPGFEVAGIVTAVGGDVSDIKTGDHVIALTGKNMGGHAHYVNVSVDNVVRKPANISFEEACSLPVVFGTVYAAFEMAQLVENEHVLIQTATGGCGLMALQLARLKNCVCYGTSSQDKKLQILKRLDVPHVINYKTTEFDKEIARITHNRGVDVVLNMLAGDGIQKGLNCLAASGRYLELAVHALKTSGKLDMSALVDNQAFMSIDLRRMAMRQQQQGTPVFAKMVELLEAEYIVPIVSRIYPFGQITEALNYVGKGEHIGKVVISHTATQVIDYTEQCIERLQQQKMNCSTYAKINKSVNEQGNAIATSPGDITGTTTLSQQTTDKKARHENIAVIGMAGQFPNAPDLNTFWKNIAEAKDCIAEIPEHRWSVAEYYDEDPQAPGKTNCKWMGVLEDADKFDPLFFSISPAEAKLMDPQQRLMLQTSWHCVEDAGIDPVSLSGSRCGVFVGCAAGDYGQTGEQALSAQGLVGGSPSILSARISYLFNLKGPCLAIDTACSSSLVALAEACNNLQLGTCDLALAGGVSVMARPDLHVMTTKAGMLSASGRCFTFDNRANGYVPGEGVGAVLVKCLSKAQQDGDTIYGVIRGWGINQDGKTNGITAPSSDSQVLLEKNVYQEFAIDPETITLVEAHGTGTKLGDPIEVSALIESFSTFTEKQHYCALGSVKSNIGHTLAAAGISGFLKVMLALKHKQLPPTIQFSELNEHINLNNSPFFINTTLQPWSIDNAMPRRAAVSSFGFSGTNAHMVVEEAPVENRLEEKLPAYLFALSAQTEEQLIEQARQLLEFLNINPVVYPGDISFTLLTGRKHFRYRLAFAVGDNAQAMEVLQQWLQTGESAGAYSNIGVSERTKEQATLKRYGNQCITQCAAVNGSTVEQYHENMATLCDLFSQGYRLDYAKLFMDKSCKKQSLPGYPFVQDRYWIDNVEHNIQSDEDNLETGKSKTVMNVIHPLVHSNTSNLQQLRFSSHFNNAGPFVPGCSVQDKSIVSCAVHLEMARIAIEEVSDLPPYANNGAQGGFILKELVWADPIIMNSDSCHVHIGLQAEENEQISYQIYTTHGQDKEINIHSQGWVELKKAKPVLTANIDEIRQSCNRQLISKQEFYGQFAANEIVYSEGCQSIQEVFFGNNQLLANIVLPDGLDHGSDHYRTVNAMEAALQLATAMHMELFQTIPNKEGVKSNRILLPFTMNELTITAPCGNTMWAWVRSRQQQINIDLCDEQGNICIQLQGVAFRADYLQKDFMPSAEKQWLFLHDKLTPASLPTTIDWSDRLQQYAGKQILFVYSKEQDQEALPALLMQLQKTADVTKPLQVQAMHISTLQDNDSLSVMPDVVLFLGSHMRHRKAAKFVDSDIRAVFELSKHLMRKGWEHSVQIYYLFSSSVSKPALDCEALSGFLKSAMMENEKHVWKMIACHDKVSSDKKYQLLLQEWLSDKAESRQLVFSEVHYQEESRSIKKLQEIHLPQSQQVVFRNNGTYLLTGGFGPMGELLCRELAKKYKAKLVILSRGDFDAKRQQQAQELEALGATVHYYAVDITNKKALTDTFEKLQQDCGPLHGVILLANNVNDGIIASKPWELFKSVIATKVNGTLYIDELTAREPLDFFMLFSSVAAYGVRGSSDYSYSSSFQNVFAQYRNQLTAAGERSGFALSTCWGPWTIDYYLRQSDREDRYEKFLEQGTDLIDIASAMPLIEASAAYEYTDIGMIAVSDLERFKTQSRLLSASTVMETGDIPRAYIMKHIERWEEDFANGKALSYAELEEVISLEEIKKLEPALIHRLYKLLQVDGENADGSESDVGQQATSSGNKDDDANTDIGETSIDEIVAETLSQILELKHVDKEESFQNYGLDSIVAMQLVTRLEKKLNREVSPSWLIDYPTVKAFAEHLTVKN